MTTLLVSHPVCAEHDPGSYHPESTERLGAVLAALDGDDFAALMRKEAPQGSIEDIERIHGADYVKSVFDAVPQTGQRHLDPDTALSPSSGEAALRAVGALSFGVDKVVSGEASNAFCPVRPPGHHAEPERAMGFCLFNNVAIAAAYARARHGLNKIAVVDFDVHHGNGTQAVFEEDKNLFYASSHQSPCYPGTGRESETGIDGNIVNVELPPGSGSEAFRQGYEGRILPRLEDFCPDLLIVSAGFDAHRDDPLAQLLLDEADYAWVTKRLLEIGARCCSGRMVSALEGGYNLPALAASAAVHVTEMMKSGA
jgi:acetoin utilization deacetylase AcuC-like enzyme